MESARARCPEHLRDVGVRGREERLVPWSGRGRRGSEAAEAGAAHGRRLLQAECLDPLHAVIERGRELNGRMSQFVGELSCASEVLRVGRGHVRSRRVVRRNADAEHGVQRPPLGWRALRREGRDDARAVGAAVGPRHPA